MQKSPILRMSLLGIILCIPVLFIGVYYGVLWKIHGFDSRFLEKDACVNAGGIWVQGVGCDATASLHPLQDHLMDLIRQGEDVRTKDPSWAKEMGQIAPDGYAIGDVSFAVVLQPNMNIPVPEFVEGDWYGVLARRGDGMPEKFLSYSRPEEDGRLVRMNALDLSIEHGQLVVSLFDDRGAGSGEGYLLRLASADGGWTWGVDGCFSYSSDMNVIKQTSLLPSDQCLIPYVPGLIGSGPEEASVQTISYVFEGGEQDARCTAKGSYVEIGPTSGLSEDMRQAMNTQMADRVVSALSGFGDGKESAADPKTAAQAFVGSCQAFFRTAQEDGYAPDVTTGWYSELQVDTSMNAKGIFSLVLSHEFYTGGAHPNQVVRTQTFSLGTGKELRWKELIEKDHVIDVAKKIATTLRSREEELFAEASEAYQAFLQRPTREEAERLFETYGEYAPTEKGLQVFFDPYEIGPYSSGRIEFTIPREELKDMILF